jgi:DNA-binding beta-propeller fold protein YncE
MRGCQLVVFATAMIVALSASLFADSQLGRPLPRVCERPVAVSVSPEGTAIAVADQFTGRIYVIDSQGRILWTTACADATLHPSAVCMISEEELLFVSRENRRLYRVIRQSSSGCDSVAELQAHFGERAQLAMISQMPDNSLLILDASNGSMYLLSPSKDSVLRFSAKIAGKVMSVALSPSRRVVVSARGHKPLQVFSIQGEFIVAPGWSMSPSTQNWDSGPVAVDLRERIWATDLTNRQIRIFDMAGTEIEFMAFPDGLDRPVALVSTSDASTLVIFENGSMVRYEESASK